MVYNKKQIKEKLSGLLDPNFVSLILGGEPQLFSIDVDGEKIEAINFQYLGEECDCYLLNPPLLRQPQADKTFLDFQVMLDEIKSQKQYATS